MPAARAKPAARYDRAADALLAAEPSDPRRIALRRRAAELYLRSGLYPEGLRALRSALRDAGVRYARTPHAALLSVLLQRVRLALGARLRHAAGQGAPGRPSSLDRERLETYWSAGVGLSLFDMVRAADFQLRHALLAHRLGEPRHRARALATEAMTLAWEGGARNRERSERIEAEATRFAAAVGDPRIEVQTLTARAALAFVERRFRDALTLCERGAQLSHTRHVGTTWEIANLELCAVSTLVCLGDMTRAAVAPARAAAGRARSRRPLQHRLAAPRISEPVLARRGRSRGGAPPDRVRARRGDAGAVPGVLRGLRRGADRSLHRGRGGGLAAHRRVLADDSGAATCCASRACASTCSSCVRAARWRSPPRDAPGRARLLRFVRGSARRLEREGVVWTAPLVASLRAGLAWQENDRARTIALLAEAAVAFERLDMGMHAAAARMQPRDARRRGERRAVQRGHARARRGRPGAPRGDLPARPPAVARRAAAESARGRDVRAPRGRGPCAPGTRGGTADSCRSPRRARPPSS